MKSSIIGCILSVIFIFGMVDFANAFSSEIYINDFESGAGTAFSGSIISNNGNVGTYHGDFSTNGSTTLTLTGLAAHTQLSLEFDLYLFNSWDGENTSFGKDYFSLSGDVNGSWTFTNHQPQGQSYPGSPDEIYGSGGGATHVYRRLDSTGTGDEFLIAHSSNTFFVTFGGPTTQTDEQWGIDNVRVSVNSAVAPEPVSSILFVTGGSFLAGRRYIKRKKIA